MTIPPVSRERILEALTEFDREHRDQPEWRNWEENKNHKYAIVHDDRRYPVKQIISMATGADRSTFSGGEESLRFLREREFSVEALRLPTEGEVQSALHDLLLSRHPGAVEPAEAHKELADHFNLSKALTELPIAHSNESHWANRVRFARRKLVDAGVIDASERGIWKLASRPNAKVWVEKCLVKGRPDREEGEHALGKALWSPMRADDGRDIYSNMRHVQPGDVVLHLTDNKAIVGVSIADERPRTDFIGISNTAWADRPCYRISLRDYQQLDPSLDRDQFLGHPDRKAELLKIHNRHKGLFYARNLELNQGAYLTEAPPELADVLNRAYEDASGQALPHLEARAHQPRIALNEQRMKGAIRLFTWLYGENPFSSATYLEEERNYKLDLAREWQRTISIDAIDQALESGPERLAEEVGRLLSPSRSNLLPWRYHEVFKPPFDRERAERVLRAVRNLLFEIEDPDRPDIDGFNEALLPDYQGMVNESALKPASHCIPSLMLWLSFPDRYFFLRPGLYNQACRILRGHVAPGQGNVMTTDYYADALAFAHVVEDSISELSPRDMIDTQGFIWAVFDRRRIWFGGKSYSGQRDMLPEFLRRQVFAVGFAAKPEVAQLLEDTPNLKKEERLARKKQLEELTEGAETKAIAEFQELCAEPGSVILLKSTWYNQKLNKSLGRIFAVGRTGNEITFDEELGHQVSTRWQSQPDFTLELGSFFPKINKTLSELNLDEALDFLGHDKMTATAEESSEEEERGLSTEEEEPDPEESEELPIQPRYRIEDFISETGFLDSEIRGWLSRLDRKKQIILQGPPGTGKTYVAERLARLLTSGTTGFWNVLQFHPSYAYEDFIQGIRPRVISGQLTYELEKGRFLVFCDEARKRDVEEPCVLIVDEINRANLSRVFGELMYLLEYRDKDIRLAGGDRLFRIPDNVYLIGTMNTADRSIALVDHALRRRFSFVHLAPSYEILEAHVQSNGLPADALVKALKLVNDEIADRNYEVGISFFMKDGQSLRRNLEEIWRGEIEPYLEEYFFDQPAKVDELRWETLEKSLLADWPGSPSE